MSEIPDNHTTWEGEEGCFATTAERKYYQRGPYFMKRCLRPSEFIIGYRGLHVPRYRKESLQNEAACLRYIVEHTKIPVPAVIAEFEHDDAYYLVTEYLEGVHLMDLDQAQRLIVEKEIEKHLAVLSSLRSARIGGPTGIVFPPYRVLIKTEKDHWDLKASDKLEFVFSHNDLSQYNIVVDPDTLKIIGIIDWEYAGFYPPDFERAFYKRPGPSAALDGETDDSDELLRVLESHLDPQCQHS